MQNDNRITALQKLYKADEKAKLVLDWLSSRLNNSGETSIERLNSIIQIERPELIRVLQSLETCGVGKFVIGRRGQQTRFVWSVGLISVGRVAQEKWKTLESWPPAIGSDRQPHQQVEESGRDSEARMFIARGRDSMQQGVMITLTRDQVRQILEQSLTSLTEISN